MIAKNIPKMWNSSGFFFLILFIIKYYLYFFCRYLETPLNFRYKWFKKKHCFAFACFSDIQKILHTLCSVRTWRDFYIISTILTLLQYFLNISVLCGPHITEYCRKISGIFPMFHWNFVRFFFLKYWKTFHCNITIWSIF